VYTSRELIVGQDENDTLVLGKRISAALMEVVRELTVTPTYVIGKGGITSSDLATEALGVRMARVLGQIFQGVPVWKLGSESRWPGKPLVVFPGNVGDEETVADIVRQLSA
jgi:uncharacterized protein YgbK (DUF1537 family)